jgi:hypothetical protein
MQLPLLMSDDHRSDEGRVVRIQPREPVNEPSGLEWLLHAAGCADCTRARGALLDIHVSGWDPDVRPALACPDGLRLLPLTDLLALMGPDGLARESGAGMQARLREHSDRVHGLRYENTHIGVAWSGGPILSSDHQRAARSA